MSQWCLGQPVNVANFDVTQMTKVWYAVGEVPVSAFGGNHTVSVECLPSMDYSTWETTASVHMITASTPTIPVQWYAMDMGHVPLAVHRQVLVHAVMATLENIASW